MSEATIARQIPSPLVGTEQAYFGSNWLFNLITGMAFGIVLPLAGNIILAELIVPVWAMFLLQQRIQSPFPRHLWLIVGLLTVTAGAVMTADILSLDGDLSKSLVVSAASPVKTWVRFGMIPVLLVSLAIVHSRRALNLRWLVIGMGFGSVMAVADHAGYLVPTASPLLDYWKYNVGSWLSVALLALLPPSFSGTQALTAGAIALLSAKLGFRSLALECALVAAIIPIRGLVNRLTPYSSDRRLWATALCLAAVVGTAAAYNVGASTGLFGRSVQLKHLAETEAAGGLLGSGRPELSAGLQAIAASPILPGGSNPKNAEITGIYIHKAAYQNVNRYLLDLQDRELLPIHSVLFDSWIRGGLLGGIAWLVAFWLAIRVMDRFIGGTLNEGYVGLLAAMLMWNIWFSPVSPQYRLTNALSVLIVCLYGSAPLIRSRSGTSGGKYRGDVSELGQ